MVTTITIYTFSDIIEYSKYNNIIKNSNIKFKLDKNATALFNSHKIKAKYKYIIENLDVSEIESMDNFFNNATITCKLDLSKWNTRNVKSMRFMFYKTKFGNFTYILNFDTSNVIDMSYMFAKAKIFANIELFTNVHNVKFFDFMFYKVDYLYNIPTFIKEWNIINAISTRKMFAGCEFATYRSINLNNWNMSNVIDMSSMFANSDFNGDISNWDVSNVINMSKLFYSSCFNRDISNWNTKNVINMFKMFANTSFNKNISNWNTSNVKNMAYMFYHSKFNNGFYVDQDDDSSYSDDIIYTDTDNDTTSIYTLDSSNSNSGSDEEYEEQSSEASDYDDDNDEDDNEIEIIVISNNNIQIKNNENSHNRNNILNWDTKNVTQMQNMFSHCPFNGDISNWDVSNVVNMSHMFKCSKFNQNISNWNTKNVIFMKGMFEKSNFNCGDISDWDVSNVIDMTNMFKRSQFTGDISKWNISSVKLYKNIFADSCIQMYNLVKWKPINIELYNYIKNNYNVICKISTENAITNNEMCIICKLDIELNDNITSCKNSVPHYYHINCLERWLKASKNLQCFCKKEYFMFFD